MLYSVESCIASVTPSMRLYFCMQNGQHKVEGNDAEEEGANEASDATADPAASTDAAPSVQLTDAAVTKLYGKWQTQEWIPPAAENGVVPKNDKGNVLAPPFAAALPKVWPACCIFTSHMYKYASAC